MEKQQQQMRSKMTVKFKGYEHLYQDGKLLEISEEEKDILFSKDTESIEDLETKLIVAVSYMEFETPSSRRVLTVDLEEVNNVFGKEYQQYLLTQAKKYISKGLLCIKENHLKVTKEGKFLSDGIASDLFRVDNLI